MKAKSIAFILAAVLIIAVTPFGSLSTVVKGVLAEAMASPPSSWQARPLAAPVGTAFTYQGQLMEGGDPADGLYDLRFILYDSEVGGSQVGSIVYKNSTLVSDGLFSVDLDFGASAFAGQARWLEIGVGPGGSGTYTALSDRQEITPTPYALYAMNADTLDGQQGTFFLDASNVDAGVLDTARYSAAADLAGEGYLGDGAGDIAQNNGVLQVSLDSDLLDGLHASDLSAAGHSHDHGALVGLLDDDHPQYFALSQGETVTGIPAFNGGTSGVTAPFSVDSTYTVSNFNADLLDGQHGSAFATAAHNHDTAYWKTTGNSGTTPGANFLGTTDNQAVELRANGSRVLRLEPNPNSPNLLGGYSGNTITSGAYGATISGGGLGGNYVNSVTDEMGTVAGGYANRAGNASGTTTDANLATVGGGQQNLASGRLTTIPGGFGALADQYGQLAYSAGPIYTTVPGSAQYSLYVMRRAGWGTMVLDLYLDPGTTDYLNIAAGKTMAFDILLVGRSDAGESAAYRFQGAIKNVGGTTSFVGTPSKTVLGEDDPVWDGSCVADNTQDALAIRVSGNSESIRWVATVQTAEVLY